MTDGFWHDWIDEDTGELINRIWIPGAPPPQFARCPVCDEIHPWEARTCPTCGGGGVIVLLALYTGDWRLKYR